MMNKAKSLAALALTAFCLLSGCAVKQQIEPVEQICMAELDKQQLMQAAEDVLGRMHFAVAKADVDQGIIRTRPLTGAQFFEFWRSDNVGSFNSAEANLHSIRRTAELDISRQQNGQLCVGCDVSVERLSLPQRQVGTARVYGMFSKSGQSIQKLKLNPEQKAGMAWTDLGRDRMLETKILTQIKKQIAQQKGQRQ